MKVKVHIEAEYALPDDSISAEVYAKNVERTLTPTQALGLAKDLGARIKYRVTTTND